MKFIMRTGIYNEFGDSADTKPEKIEVIKYKIYKYLYGIILYNGASGLNKKKEKENTLGCRELKKVENLWPKGT